MKAIGFEVWISSRKANAASMRRYLHVGLWDADAVSQLS